VLPDDVKRMMMPVLGHRLIIKPESRLRKITPAAIVNDVLGDVSVPVPGTRGARAEEEEVVWQ